MPLLARRTMPTTWSSRTLKLLTRRLKMPNWCYNNVDITAATDEQKDLLDRVSRAEAADGFFAMFRPIGEWDYNVALEKWGTKWDVDPLDVDFDGTTMSTSFDSAWAPPIALYEYLKEQGFEVT